MSVWRRFKAPAIKQDVDPEEKTEVVCNSSLFVRGGEVNIIFFLAAYGLRMYSLQMNTWTVMLSEKLLRYSIVAAYTFIYCVCYTVFM